MTESRQIGEELVRGAIAVATLALGSYMLGIQPVVAAFLFVVAIIAVRGCAFCWLYGLFGAARACNIRSNPTPPKTGQN
jgi:hypothetical protein